MESSFAWTRPHYGATRQLKDLAHNINQTNVIGEKRIRQVTYTIETLDTDNPGIAKQHMEKKLKIAGFVERFTIKVDALKRQNETVPKITSRIDYHQLVSRVVLLGNEWRELINTWHNIGSRRSSPDNMYGMRSIIYRTKAKVLGTLHVSQQ